MTAMDAHSRAPAMGSLTARSVTPPQRHLVARMHPVRNAMSYAMMSMPSFSLNVFRPTTTVWLPPGSTTNVLVDGTDPHRV